MSALTRDRRSARAALADAAPNALTLCLVVAGGAVFPMAFAFRLTGLALGLAAVVAVAALNYYTCALLIRAAALAHARAVAAGSPPHRGALSFEALAKRTFGEAGATLSRVALVALLFGTNCGGLAVIAEAGGRALCGMGLVRDCGVNGGGIVSGDGPFLLPNANAAGACAVASLTLVVLAPLCLMRDITRLDRAGALGVVLLLALVVVVVRRAVATNAPFATEAPMAFVLGRPNWECLQAFPVLGYALYVHPVLLPMLAQMVARAESTDEESLEAEEAEADAEGGGSRLSGTSTARRRNRREEPGRRYLGGRLRGFDDADGSEDGDGTPFVPGTPECVSGTPFVSGTTPSVSVPLLATPATTPRAVRVARVSRRGVVRVLIDGGADEDASSDVFHDAEESLLGTRSGSEASSVGYPGDLASLTRDGDGDGDGDGDLDLSAAVSRCASSLETSVLLSLGFAVVAYALVGAAGYATFGDATRDNVLLNLGSPALDAAMAVYQAICFPPTFHSLRGVAYALVDGGDADFPAPGAHAARVFATLAAAATVAATLPHSERIFAVTGAVGVAAVCYAFPVAMWVRVSGGGVGGGGVESPRARTNRTAPAAALAAGVALSALGLWAALEDEEG